VNQSDEIEPVLDGVVEAYLLISPVSLIHRIEQHGQRKRERFGPPQHFSVIKGSVRRAVVDNQNLDLVIVQQARGNPLQRRLDRFFGVVGDDKDQQSLSHGE